MEPIADIASLQPVLQSLIDKGLVIPLSPPGRGQSVTHALFLPEEMDKVRKTHQASVTATGSSSPSPPRNDTASAPHSAANATTADDDIGQLRNELDELRGEVRRLKQEMQDLWDNLR